MSFFSGKCKCEDIMYNKDSKTKTGYNLKGILRKISFNREIEKALTEDRYCKDTALVYFERLEGKPS